MRYFVTGATGFIGGEVARQLIAAGHQVTALVRSPEKAAPLAALGVTICQGDITDRASLREAMRGADGVFHLAAWYRIGARDKRPAYTINVEGTRNVLEIMRELAIPKGVYTSTVGVFSDTHGQLVDETYRHNGPFLTEYERTKWLAHYEVAGPLMRAGLPLVIVLPGVVYGPGDTSLLHTYLVQYFSGKLRFAPRRTAYCWAHVEDTARAHLLAMEKGRVGEDYIIAGPPHSFLDILQIGQDLFGIPQPRLKLSPAWLKGLARVMGIIEQVVPLPQAYTAESLRAVAGTTYIASNAKARRELGFDPRPAAEGLRETGEYEIAHLRRRPTWG